MIRGRNELAKTSAHDVALDCIEAGIEAARPTHAMRAALERTGAELWIDESTLDLDDRRRARLRRVHSPGVSGLEQRLNGQRPDAIRDTTD